MFPHEVFFLLFNAVYILPVIYVYFFGFSEGGVGSVFSLTPSLLEQMLFFYLFMSVSFFMGSRVFGFGVRLGKDDGVFSKLSYSSVSLNVIFVIVVFVHVLFKYLLMHEGVYDSYAYDSGAMNSKTWTISMGLSELVIALFILFLFTGCKKRAFICFLAIGLNLLHGSRIFTLISIFVYCIYFVYYMRLLSGYKLILYAVTLIVVVLVSFFVVFLYRSGIQLDFDSISFEMLISPVVYESLFNQFSFLTMLDKLNRQQVPFSAHMYILDALKFMIPGFFDAREDIYVSSFGNLSPLGGLSGYASAIIYFSNYYFVWYFIVGSVLSLLLRAARSASHRLLSRFLYVYIVCDTFFRLHRDPFYISMKMLVNNFLFVVFIIVLSYFLRSCFRRRSAG